MILMKLIHLCLALEFGAVTAFQPTSVTISGSGRLQSPLTRKDIAPSALFAAGKDAIRTKPAFGAGAPKIINQDATSKSRHEEDDKYLPQSSADVMSNLSEFADSKTRRQLLFSLLVSAASTSLIPTEASATSTAIEVTGDIAAVEETSVANAFKSFSGNLIIPPMDTRSYETLTLPNGLRVVLCSDPSSLKAAAAMDVHVGAASDPEEVRGLAHFCEHSK